MTFYTSRSVLVTGGASFIGSHLVERLVQSGAKVRVADDLSSGRMENLTAVQAQIDFRLGDLRDPVFARECCAGVDVVFHLAACHGGRGYIDTHPVECSGNMILDGVVFAAAHAAGVDRICFASSACVYPTNLQEQAPDSKTVLLKEEWANPHIPGRAAADGEYGWAKLMGELVLNSYHKQFGTKSVCCRIFTAYGERENETHAIIAFIARAFAGADPFVIWGNGEQDRNFTYVGDIVEGLMRAAEAITDASPVNIGTSEHIKIRHAAELVLEMTGYSPSRLQFDLTKPVGVFSRAADLTTTRAKLGWEPATPFAVGLKKTIDWYYATKDAAEVRQHLEKLLTER